MCKATQWSAGKLGSEIDQEAPIALELDGAVVPSPAGIGVGELIGDRAVGVKTAADIRGGVAGDAHVALLSVIERKSKLVARILVWERIFGYLGAAGA